MKGSIHEQVTARIVAAIEANPGECQMPWVRAARATGWPVNASTDKRYQGINTISLWCAAQMREFKSPRWATFRQWEALGCQVKKGAKGEPIVFYKQVEVARDGAGEGDEPDSYRMARGYWVFNADEVEGEAAATPVLTFTPLGDVERLARVDAYVAGTGAQVVEQGDRAYYSPSRDVITMPEQSRFTGTATMTRSEAYYGVLLHELVHWTGHDKRQARDFGDVQSATACGREELVAELGAAFLCADLRVTPEVRADHAQYLASWLALFKRDPNAIFTAAAAASRAVAYLDGLQVKQEVAA